MMIRKYVLASAFGLTGAILAVNCGNSGNTATATSGGGDENTSGPSTSPSTAGTGGTGGASTGSLTTTNGTGGMATSTTATAGTGGTTNTTASSGTGGSECGEVTTLHPPQVDAGLAQIYCPFSGVDGGANLYCENGTQQCCEPSSGTSVCDVKGTACTGTNWQCDDPTECGEGMMCCGIGSLVMGVPQGNKQCGNYGSKFDGTHCAASCAATEIVMCTSSAECPAATPTCTPFYTKANQVGGCTQ